MTQIVFGSRVRKSPFFDATITGGVTAFSIYNHMFMPVSYGDPIGEYERVKTGVSMWDVGAERQVEIVGPDATTV
ncbi:MAG: glycine cleavage system protein T, partial [Acidimicrobiaceae bacterium]|nr:glycine cleavage system protein T [Acidimicrobiaceae bacterium]